MPKRNEIRQPPGAARRRPGELFARILIMGLLALVPATCVAPQGVLSVPSSRVRPTASAAPAGILDAAVQPTTFDVVRAAIDKLYSSHPDVNSYAVKGVTYTPQTRDKVLKICHEGGLVSSEAERESQEVLACAPLIFFFYNYGHESGVAESTAVARLMYWYTVSNHSSQSKEVLTQLLRGWGLN
jgi:hypothetical protein